MSQIDVLEQIMLTIDEVKGCLAMNDLPVVYTNREQNSYVKKIYNDYFCANDDHSIIINAFDDFEPISSSIARYFTVYVNDVLVLKYVGDKSYNSDIYKIFDKLPFMTLTPEHLTFFIEEINTKGTDCVVYFDRESEKVIDYDGDQNINLLYVTLGEGKYKDKSFYKVVNGELLYSYGLYTNQYFANDEYKKYFTKIAYLRNYYSLYSFIIYQSFNSKTVRLLVNTYDFEIVLNNSDDNPELFTEPDHSDAYRYEKNKRDYRLCVDTSGVKDIVAELIDKVIEFILKEYPCSEFEKFISESGRYYSSLEDHEFEDYIKLFRMITI